MAGDEAGRKSQTHERAEAIYAADQALEHLNRAAEKLDSAGNWGMFDIFAGGMFSSLVKHGRIQEAEAEFNEARRAVLRFVDELEDVEDAGAVNFDIGGLASGIDIFFDNIFADIYVQSKIGEAKERVAAAIEQISAIRAQLMRG